MHIYNANYKKCFEKCFPNILVFERTRYNGGIEPILALCYYYNIDGYYCRIFSI